MNQGEFFEQFQNDKAREGSRKAEERLLARVMVLIEADNEDVPSFHYREAQGLPLCGHTGPTNPVPLSKARHRGQECTKCTAIHLEMSKGWPGRR